MNRNTIGSWLLALGTVLGALAAANSHKSGKLVGLDYMADHPGQFLLHDLVTQEGELALPAGSELTAANVELVRNAGFEQVLIRVPAQPVEEVSGLEAMVGRVLAEDVVLSTEPRSLAAGSVLRFSDLRELREGGIETLRIEGESQPVPVGAAGTFDLAKAVLAEDVSFELPTKVAAGSFLTEERAQALLDAGKLSVPVRVPKKFTFADWDERLVFLLGVLLMLAGIAFKRMVPTGAAEDAAGPSLGIREVRAKLEEVARQAAALAERVDDLTAAEIHLAVDGILTEGCYPIVESRQAIAGALGQAGFAEVMSSFSSGERRLNRAWSAAVDEYPAEARLSVRESVPYMEAALASLGTS